MSEKDETVTMHKLRLWKAIAIGAFLLGGLFEYARNKLTAHDEGLSELKKIAHGLNAMVENHGARIKALEELKGPSK